MLANLSNFGIPLPYEREGCVTLEVVQGRPKLPSGLLFAAFRFFVLCVQLLEHPVGIGLANGCLRRLDLRHQDDVVDWHNLARDLGALYLNGFNVKDISDNGELPRILAKLNGDQTAILNEPRVDHPDKRSEVDGAV